MFFPWLNLQNRNQTEMIITLHCTLKWSKFHFCNLLIQLTKSCCLYKHHSWTEQYWTMKILQKENQCYKKTFRNLTISHVHLRFPSRFCEAWAWLQNSQSAKLKLKLSTFFILTKLLCLFWPICPHWWQETAGSILFIDLSWVPTLSHPAWLYVKVKCGWNVTFYLLTI